jgi:lambda family phage tail tape measure protein
MKKWRETQPGLEARTFQESYLTMPETSFKRTDSGAMIFDEDIMSPLVAKAKKLKDEFKLVGGADGIIDAMLFGDLHAEDIKESVEMIKTSWEWFEKSQAVQTFIAMNKVLNEELSITHDLSDATRARSNYEITERQMIEANISATERQIQAETDRWNAMRASSVPEDWAGLDAQAKKIDALTEKLKDYNNQLAKTSTPQTLVVALKKYTDEAADVWKQYADATTSALKGIEDVFVDLCKTGKLNFTNLADSIISDLIRIQLRANVTGPLSSWISGLFSVAPAFTEADFLTSAKGNAFRNGNVIRLALGGIVNRPTLFKMASGAGLMGEAGPEAVMPLTRDSKGRLGVSTSGASPQNIQVQIINQSGNSVKGTESKATFDGQKTVVSVVIDALTRNAYGLRDVVQGVK